MHGRRREGPCGSLPQQLVDGHVGGLALDVPERHVDGGDGRHRDRTAAPVCAAVEELPGVLDLRGVAADEELDDVVLEVADHGELAAIDRGIAEAGEAVIRRQLERDEVAIRTGDNDFYLGDIHSCLSAFVWRISGTGHTA